MEKHPERIPDWRVIATLRRIVRLMLAIGTLAAVLIGAAFAVFTWVLLPRLDQYRPLLESELARATGRQVSIARLSGQWEGVAPRLSLQSLSIADPAGGRALTLSTVDIKPSWTSLLTFEPRLALIEINGPGLSLRRSRDDQLFLNGFPLTQGKSDGRFGNWLLRQSRVVVRGARIDWQDDFLGLPPLGIEQGVLELTHGLWGHRLHVGGRPTFSPQTGIDISARWSGDDIHDWKSWDGSLSLRLDNARVGAWNRYLSAFGLLRSGQGNGALEVSFSDGHIDSLDADIRVSNAAWRIPDGRELVFPELGGRLQVERQGETYSIHASDLTLASQTGLAFNHTRIDGRWQQGVKGFGELTLDNADLHHLTPFIHALGADSNPLFGQFSPAGQVTHLTVSWKGDFAAPSHYALDSRFSDLAWSPVGGLPGIAGATGQVRFDEKGGVLTLATGKSRVTLPEVFPEPLGFSRLDGKVEWQLQNGAATILIRKLAFANDDLSGALSGSYRYTGKGAGLADLRASLDGVPATSVMHYLPYAAGVDTRAWLTRALKGGRLDDVSMVLKGDMDAFPFQGGKGGEFLVKGSVRKASLLFQTGWPLLEGIDASLLFHNERMEVTSTAVSTLGVPLHGVKVTIPDLMADNARLDIVGKAAAPLSRMLAYTVKSPVDAMLSGFTGQIRADGNATLELGIIVPLSGPETTRVTGHLGFAGNTLTLSRLPLPALENVTGPLTFTEQGVSSPGLTLAAFGGRFALSAKTEKNGRMQFALDGDAPTRNVLSRYVDVLGPFVDGHSRFAARFAVKQGLENLLITSDLLGTAIKAPAPVSKEAASALPLSVQVRPETSGVEVGFTLDGRAAGRFQVSDEGDLKNGVVAVGRALPAVAQDGLQILVSAPELDLGPWVEVVKGQGGAAPGWPLTLNVDSPLVKLGRHHLDKVSAEVRHAPGSDEWQVKLRSTQLNGRISYLEEAGGQIRARLPRLELASSALSLESNQEAANRSSATMELPALDIKVDELVLDGRSVGSLELAARRQGQDWLMDKVLLKAQHGSLQGSAKVLAAQGSTPPSVDTRFALDASDVGKMLERFGVKDTFRKGQGRLWGELSWPGGLSDLSLDKVSGRVAMDLKDGRFAQVDPGVARLLGVISLQSLTRRIRLDFTDVFSDGFAFDSLKGEASVSNGVFRSDSTQMKGPAADVSIKGQVNLVTETQTLSLHVEPHLAEGVALATGAALINPVVGVAALAAQKVLKDPVGKIFSVDYDVTGSLREPVVSKKPARQSQRKQP